MASFESGTDVRIAAREQTPADVKSGLYYPHFAGLRGKVLKIFGEEASVLVDRTTLPPAIKTRHDENEKAMRQRYLDGLSDEARNRMSAKEKQFSLNYAVLVALKDLLPDEPSAASGPLGDLFSGAEEGSPASSRVSASDLEAKEAAFLAERAAKSGGDPLTRPVS